MTDAWVARYLELLGVDSPAVSPGDLARLTRAHLLAVPFENVSALLRRHTHLGRAVPPVDPDTMLRAWQDGRAGGVCFEVTDLFGRLLRALGYRAQPVLASRTFLGAHQALLVELDAQRYLVDVGNGAPFFEPIPLHGSVVIRRAGLAYRFRPHVQAGWWVQDRWIDGAWDPFFLYQLEPPDPRVREGAYQHHHTPGESWVVGSLVLIRCEEDEVSVLRNGDLTRYTREGKHTERVSGAAAYERLAGEVFNMPGLPTKLALDALAELTS